MGRAVSSYSPKAGLQSTGTLSGRETDFRPDGAPERFRASEGPAGVRGISRRGKRSARKGCPGA